MAPGRALTAAVAIALALLGYGSEAEARSWRWIAFFDFGSDAVGDHARQLIDDFVGFKKGACRVEVELIGHIDGGEALASDAGLDLARAQAIAEAFKRVGPPAWKFTLVGRGYSYPLVQTPAGVREPQNRRVELHFRDMPSGPIECGPPSPPELHLPHCWVTLADGTKCWLGI
jgi:OmpA-OmpF porin, OOP family